MKRINRRMLKDGLLKRCIENIRPRHDDRKCFFCGQPLMEFVNPLTGECEPEIKCRCELHLEMLSEAHNANSKIYAEEIAAYYSGRKLDYHKKQHCEFIINLKREIDLIKGKEFQNIF